MTFELAGGTGTMFTERTGVHVEKSSMLSRFLLLRWAAMNAFVRAAVQANL